MDEIVYSSENRLRKSTALFQEMLYDLKRSKSITIGIMIRNIRAQYRQLLLGRLWALFPGLAAAFALVKIRNAGILHVAHTEIPYSAYVVFGMMLWQTFTDALEGPIHGITADRGLIRVQNVPAESLILARQGEMLLHFSIKFICVLIILLLLGVKLQWTTFLAPVALLSLVFFATAIGLILAPLNLLYQDVTKGLGFLTTAWLFLTPVIYPRPMKGAFAFLVNLNPVTPMIVTIRELVASPVLTQLRGFLLVSFFATVAMLFAWLIFRLTFPFAIERLNH